MSTPICAASGPVATPLQLASLVDEMEARLAGMPAIIEQRPAPAHVDGAQREA